MRILVAHPAQQHSYRMAAALEKAGMLQKYATTVYYKKNTLTAVAAKLLKGRFRVKAENRRCAEIPDQKVIQFCEAEGLLKLLALNTVFLKNTYRKIKYTTADHFAIKTARYALSNNVDAVITYDDTSPILFEVLREKAPDVVRIMDMSAANILYMRGIYEKDIQMAPQFEKRLRNERKICWDPFTLERTRRELNAAQFFLVPSDFVRRSLEYSGIQGERIFTCPYGVDTERFGQKEYESIIKGSRPLKFIYVGGVKEFKGIFYLLEAFRQIPAEKAFLTVVGKYNPKDEDIAAYADFVIFTGPVLHSEVPGHLQKADVFILPSLGEGMALSAIEAASCGLPLLVSENTGMNDLIQDGVNGFLVPIQSVKALTDKINYFIDHPEQVAIMGKKARRMAEQYTWDNYSDQIEKVISTILRSHVPDQC